MKRQIKLIFSLYILTTIFATSLFAQDNLKKYHNFDFSKKVLSKTEVGKLDEYDAGVLRGIVFGKRGRIFKEQAIRNYLAKQSWYKPNAKFTNAILTVNERKNIDVIREVEAEKHAYIQPGDLRFWVDKKITGENLSPQTAAEWRVLIAEVEAIHGKTFTEEPWLQKYFEERYWYKANPNYSPTILTENERQNLTAIIEARDKERKVAISPGDMDKFQNTLLTEVMLENVTLNEARIMRNEFFARRGKKFTTPGYRGFFEWQDWYKPIKNQNLVKLNETEKANVRTIENYERKIREGITTKVISEEALQGLFTEDLRVLRNEIYARHGRVFKDAELQKTFAAMNWYKPDPSYTDEMLTEIEKQNLKTIVEVEKEAISKLNEVEG